MSAQSAVSRCRNCRENFPSKKGKRFCKDQCRVDFHKAGATPSKAIEARMKKMIRSGLFRGVISDAVRDEVALQLAAASLTLQRAHAVQPQPVETDEESAKQKAGSVKTASSV
jgi:hypothetical protein